MRSLQGIFTALLLLHSHLDAVSVTGEESEGCGCSVKSAPREGNHQLSSSWQIAEDTSAASCDTEGYTSRKMVQINGGIGYMGTDDPKIPRDGEGPQRQIEMSSFLMDKYEVSNNDFQAFVAETGYTTESEIFGWSFVFHTAIPEKVIKTITSAVLNAEWWLPVNGSYWKYPEGPLGGSERVLKGLKYPASTSSADGAQQPDARQVEQTSSAQHHEQQSTPGHDVFSTGRGDHAVVQVSWNDAQQYCAWRGARLPTEAEWEFAASGNSYVANDNKENMANKDGNAMGGSVVEPSMFPWGEKLYPNKTHRANIFQGTFPTINTAKDGFEFISPVDAFPPQNAYGLHNMIGNVWEWVSDWHTTQHVVSDVPLKNPTGPTSGTDKVKKGGSFLCHKSYCFRYRTAARFPSTADSGTYNIGFRCAKDIPAVDSFSEEL